MGQTSLSVFNVPVDLCGEGMDVGEELGDSRDGSGEVGESLTVALREVASMEEDGQACKQVAVEWQRDGATVKAVCGRASLPHGGGCDAS